VELAEVSRLLGRAGLKVTREGRLPNDKGYKVECETGEVVVVYDSGAVVPGGANVERLREVLGLPIESAPGPTTVPAPSKMRPRASQTVFVVYGHDRALRDQLEVLLHRWGLTPIILDELPSEGATIIEKLEKYQAANLHFAVVLATPDDEGCPRGGAAHLRPRARQNVVLELGMLLNKLGRKRVAVLVQTREEMERPSDIAGLIYLPFTDSISEVRADLAREMATAGLSIRTADL
jgi:predicted nucleotide-binding protein